MFDLMTHHLIFTTLFEYTNRISFGIRFATPFIVVGGGIIWFLYLGVIKKDWKEAFEILRPALFFGAVWALIFYFLFS